MAHRGVPIACFLSVLAACDGTVFQIDRAYPFISVNGVPVQWHSGAAAHWALSSLLVRVHPRGIMFKPKRWHMRDLAGLGWRSAHCPPSAHGLCQAELSVYFPSSQAPEVGEARAGECGSSGTGRVIVNGTRYDTSSCDVVDALGDFVLHNNVMSRQDTSLPLWVYWTVCIMVIFLIRCLSRYILSSLSSVSAPGSSSKPGMGGETDGDGDVPNAWMSLAVSAAATILVVTQGSSAFVTHEDLLFYWFTVFYIFAYACLFLGARAVKRIYRVSVNDPPFYNLIAGVLQLVATRLYAGAETPYNPPMLFIIAVRALTKSRRCLVFLRGITLVLDAFMLGLMAVLGFSPAPQYLAAIFVGASVWADYLYKDTRRE